MLSTVTTSRRPKVRLVLASLALVLLGTIGALWLNARSSAATYVPLPVYEIESTSGAHHASFLNLPLGQPGVPQVPSLVDVDGDLLPDVAVSVNLVDSQGVLNNPPDVGAIIAPNLVIDRLPTAVLLGQPSPPLRIEIKLRLVDVGGSGPEIKMRFGYETGPGGTIPTRFKAVVGGLQDGFNPLEVVADTGPSSGSAVTYRGPLRLVGGIDDGTSAIDLGFHYRPLPDQIRLTYSSDDAGGQHITYAHSAPRDVDLTTTAKLTSGASVVDFTGRVDRLPGAIALDLATDDDGGGSVTYHADANGRAPDVDVSVLATEPGSEPLAADLTVEALPADIHATWSLPEQGPVDVAFEAGGQGIGAVDVDVRNYLGTSPHIAPFVPVQQQYLALQQAGPAAAPHRRITGRVERIRSVDFHQDDRATDVTAELGDGELPLEVLYDCRAACSEDGTLARLDTHATVTPLPDSFSAHLLSAGDDQSTEPMEIHYTASDQVDVDAKVVQHSTGVASGAACGDLLVLCADVNVRYLPASLDAVIARVGDVLVDGESAIHLDVDSADPLAGQRPDVTAHVVDGGETAADTPLVADADVLGLPEHIRVRLHQTLDETGQPKLDQARFFACSWDFDADQTVDVDRCAPGTAGDIGSLQLSLRSFLDRPAGFPIPTPTTPLYAAVVGRGEHTEVAARFTGISQVQYLNTPAMVGIRARAGTGADDFAATFDLEGVELADDPPGEPERITDATLDLHGTATVSPMPAEMDVCLRTANETLTAAVTPFTAACTEHPFGASVQPQAVAYRLSATADVAAAFDARTQGTLHQTLFGFPFTTPYDETTGGEIGIPGLPDRFTAHVQVPPKDTEGPIHAVYDTNTQLDITIGAHQLRADSVCLDPRSEAKAMCLSALLENLPAHADVLYDPTKGKDNLKVTTDSSAIDCPLLDPLCVDRMNVKDVELSVKTPKPGVDADTLIVTGQVLGLPASVRGTLVLPKELDDPTIVDVCASTLPCSPDTQPTDRIDTVDLHAKNFVVPDPTPLGDPNQPDMPAQRQVYNLPVADQYVVLYQRGELFHAAMHIEDVAGVGYRTESTPDATKALETQEVSIDFGIDDDPATDPVIRAYADVDKGTSHTIADVTLRQIPAGVRMCIRGADLTPNEDPDPATVTFCDSDPVDPDGPDTTAGADPDPDNGPTDDEGAFQLKGRPGADLDQLDVDAYVRQSTGGNVDVASGAVHVENVPFVVQGTYPVQNKGSLDVSGLTEAGELDGFDEIAFEVAGFDIDSHYPDPPFVAKGHPGGAFPAPELADQYASMVIVDDVFHARGRVFGLSHIAVRDTLCDPLDRGDYPLYPEATELNETTYTCIQADVDQGAGQPMNVHAVVHETDPTTGDVEIFSMTDAGVTALPEKVQITIAETPTTLKAVQNEELRTPCGTVDDHDQDGDEADENCMPPLIRFDSVGQASELFGRLQIGLEQHLDELLATSPRGTAVDQVVFSDIATVPAPGSPGANVLIGSFEPTQLFPAVIEGTAAHVGFRVPVPYSLTVDQPQTWKDEEEGDHENMDLRFHYVARENASTVLTDLGRAKALIASFPTGSQIQLSGAAGEEYGGVSVPGELYLGMYLRKKVVNSSKIDERMFVQIDGATNRTLGMHAVILAATTPSTIEELLTPSTDPDRIDVHVLNLQPGPYNGPEDPSFRARAEIISEVTEPDSCDAGSCSESFAKVEAIRALLDFAPEPDDDEEQQDAAPARFVKAVIRLGSQNNIQIQGFADVAGSDPTPYSAVASVEISPLTIYWRGGVPLLANLEFGLDVDLKAAVTIDRAEDFRLYINGPGMTAIHKGPGTESAIGPIDLNVYQLYAQATLALITLSGVEYFPTYDVLPQRAALDFVNCSSFGDFLLDEQVLKTVPGYGIYDLIDDQYGRTIDANEDASFLIMPALSGDPYGRLKVTGSGPDFIQEILAPAAKSIGCLATDPDEIPLIDGNHPGVPEEVPGHGVPGIGETDFTEPVQDTQEPAPDGVIDTDTEMCGTHIYGHLTVTAKITVASAPGPNCPASSVSGLDLVANEMEILNDGVDTHGEIDAHALVTGDCTLANVNYHYATGLDPIEAQFDCEEYLASGAGAGHYSEGGRGGSPFIGGPEGEIYGFDGFFPIAFLSDPTLDAGWRGGGPDAGFGGGVVSLAAELITLEGPLDASGGNGGDLSATGCDNDGPVASGGGSGGGIAIKSPKVIFGPEASLSVRGGNGGNGLDDANGGGGGAAGRIEIFSPVMVGFDSSTMTDTTNGQGGTSTCNDGFDAEPSLPVDYATKPQSRAYAFTDGFWKTTDENDVDDDGVIDTGPLLVDFSAASADPNTPHGVDNDNGFQVALCGIRFPAEWADLANSGGFQVVASTLDDLGFPVDDTCGTSVLEAFIEVTRLSYADIRAAEYGNLNQIRFADNFFASTGHLTSGFWGLFTRVFQPVTPGNDCLDATDGFEIGGDGHLYDQTDCLIVEDLPDDDGVDMIVGIDNVDPVAAETVIVPELVQGTGAQADHYYTNSQHIGGTVDSQDVLGPLAVSGIDHFVCYEEHQVGPDIEREYFDCGSDEPFDTYLTDGDGDKRITVEAVDRVGNRTPASAQVVLDTNVPDVQISRSFEPDRANGWFSVSPTYTLFGFDPQDPDADVPAPPAPVRYLYQVDDGPEKECPDVAGGDDADFSTCVIPDHPGGGTHIIHYTAVDLAGNRGVRVDPDLLFPPPAMKQEVVMVDNDPPLTQTYAAPLVPDGDNGWYQSKPWFGIGVYDPPVGGSGIDQTMPPSVLRYRIDSNGDTGTITDYPGPFQLPPGTHQLCSQGRDVAGNPIDDPLPLVCDPTVYQVDPVAPLVTIVAPAPDGSNGWYVTEPTASVLAIDSLIFGPDVEVSGVASVMVSVDGGPYVAYGGAMTFGEGDHVLRAFATDVAGNQSPTQERVFHVDRSHPVTTARLFPPDPARATWWRALPTVVLRATDGDQNAGVAGTDYRLDNGPWVTYTAPFEVPEGVHTVSYRSRDRSGAVNDEPVRTLQVPVDVTPPTVVATSPSPAIWSRLLGKLGLGPKVAQLRWTVSDNLSGNIGISVLVYNVLGQLVRTIDGGTVNVPPGATYSGLVLWDGTDQTLLGLVPLGLYHYRVVATDEAGNAAQSAESKPIQIKL